MNGNCPLLPGNNQYKRFIKIFHRVIHDNKETFHIIGVEEHSLESHSCQKGAIILCSSGCIVTPPMVSICLRDCWSMGPVKDWYINYKKASDQFTGRSVTAISSLTNEFAISPPHWDFTDSTEYGMKEKVDQLLSNDVVRENDVYGYTFIVLRFIFASICYHYEHLDKNLHKKMG